MEKRYKLDCREAPDSHCSLVITGKQDEVLEAGFVHAITAHGYQDSPDLRSELREMLKEESEVRAPVGAGGGAQGGASFEGPAAQDIEGKAFESPTTARGRDESEFGKRAPGSPRKH